MTDLQPTYDPRAEAAAARERMLYHANEAAKFQRWTVATARAALRVQDETSRDALRECADHARTMADYHVRNEREARELRRAADDRVADLDHKDAAALRAAADAADAMGCAILATELNRRAARAEGYDPDDAGDDGPREDRPDCDEGTPNTPARDDPDWPAKDREY